MACAVCSRMFGYFVPLNPMFTTCFARVHGRGLAVGGGRRRRLAADRPAGAQAWARQAIRNTGQSNSHDGCRRSPIDRTETGREPQEAPTTGPYPRVTTQLARFLRRWAT